MKTNYFLIDYENVQPKSLQVLNGQPVKVIVFLGANQGKVSVEVAKALQSLGSNAEYVQISGNGPNAVDFHITFTMGEISKSDESARFHIISKDSGFDPLIEYLRTKRIVAQRSAEIPGVPIRKTKVPEKLEAIIRNLSSRNGRPRKVTTLSNTINALFQKSLDEAEVMSLIKALEKHGHIAIQGENVSYPGSASV